MTREYAMQFRATTAIVRKKAKFFCGVAATGTIGGDEFSIFAPNMVALQALWIKVMATPLDESRVQRIAVTREGALSELK